MAIAAPIQHLITSANVITNVGTITAAGTYLLNICNDHDEDTTLEVWITPAADSGLSAPTGKHKIEPGAAIKAKDLVSRWPVPLEADAKVWVRVGVASKVSVSLLGREE